MAGQSVNHRRKEILESCDNHLHTAIDRAWALWVDIAQQHPFLAHYLVDLMVEIERSRFLLEQFYHLAWGGRPGWMLQMTEITHQLRRQRAQWAREMSECREFGRGLADLEQK